MKLLPSLKQKKRYIVFEIIGDQFNAEDTKKSVEEALLLFLGQLGLAKTAPLFLSEKFKDNKFMIKINHKFVDECKAAIILIKKIKNKEVIVKSIVTSGTLKKASGYL
ncbi:MAG TPA: Rpp14/Pop5 family protein [Candidatus Nanoarchaeia archaeon]|nr:Rpp14/Pop5 family protein [Candidatus Nanoarchaeia archaeon]